MALKIQKYPAVETNNVYYGNKGMGLDAICLVYFVAGRTYVY